MFAPLRCLLLLAVFALAACGPSAPRLPALPAGSVVLAFGDSVTHGTGAAPGEDYPARLAAISGWQVLNHGVPGDTAQAARARIEAVLEDTRPALVLLEIGGNDFLRRRDEAAVKADVRALVEAVRRQGAQPVLVAVPRLSPLGAAVGRLKDSALYAELAREERVPLVAEVFSGVLSDPDLRADPIHPNARGYQRLAEGIAGSLAESGLLARR